MNVEPVHSPLKPVAAPLVLGLAVVLLAACGEQAPLLKTGGYGTSTFLLWQEPGRPPLLMQTENFRQEDELFQHMHFEDVLVRCPSPDAVIYLRAHDAEVRAGSSGITAAPDNPAAPQGAPSAKSGAQHSAAVLAGDPANADEAADTRLDLATVYSSDGNGGRLADGVHLAGSDHGLPVVGVASEVRVRPVDHAVVCEHLRMSSGAGAPALAAALGALPHPLVLPEIRAGNN
jgi:hypothetical protein